MLPSFCYWHNSDILNVLFVLCYLQTFFTCTLDFSFCSCLIYIQISSFDASDTFYDWLYLRLYTWFYFLWTIFFICSSENMTFDSTLITCFTRLNTIQIGKGKSLIFSVSEQRLLFIFLLWLLFLKTHSLYWLGDI